MFKDSQTLWLGETDCTALVLFVGVEEKLDSLNQLKVKGLVLGPIHRVQADQPSTLDLQTINPVIGDEESLNSLLERAHKKGEGL